MPVHSTEEEESRRTKRESAASLYKARTTAREKERESERRGGDWEAGAGKGEMRTLEETAERRQREKSGQRGSERDRAREKGGRGSERTSTRLGGYVRIIILRYSHIYKSAI